jgi:hypothetical protein
MDALAQLGLVTCSAGSAARAHVQRLAARKMQGFLGTIDSEGAYLTDIYLSAKSVGEAVAADYHGRFLVELIQNANDVHPAERQDGEIEVVFDRSAGPYGILYVANRGAPFAASNVDALCALGLSSKPPGEAIGNKGLGFRSIRHICDAPQIYSQVPGLEGNERFEGFCFRFAEPHDLATMIDDPRHVALAVRDLPPFHVPICLVEQSEEVQAFAARGFATVVVLPVRSADAAIEVLHEIDAIRSLQVPMLLFLSRLAQLTVRAIEVDGSGQESLVLSRSEAALEAAGARVSIVELGPLGRHLIALRAIDEASMLVAIRKGVEQKQLHSHWLEWTGEGEVALAVRLDGVIADPRLFTFLPLGEQALSPFRGHLHASFFPTSNRKGLDGKVTLNALLLDQAANLAAETVAWLAAGDNSGLADTSRACAAVDLMCWRKAPSFETLTDLPAVVAQRIAVETGVINFDDAPVVPVLSMSSDGETIEWKPPRSSRRWSFGGHVFSVNAAATYAEVIGTWPIWMGLGTALDRLVEYLKRQSPAFTDLPTPSERADLAVCVATSLSARTGISAALWTAFYKQLRDLLGVAGAALAQKPILLGEDGKLHLAMSSTTVGEVVPRGRRRRTPLRTAVFSPPAQRGVQRVDLERLSPPASLAENFAFLSDKLDWYGELTDARSFLEQHKLVLEFDRDSILTQLSRVLREDRRNLSRAAGLRWAFQIWRRPQETGRGFALQPSHRFYVPTMNGSFIEAHNAFFSDGWPDVTHGRLLQRFLDVAPSESTDLAYIAERRLASRSHYSFKGGTTELWTSFLSQLGVKRGLNPMRRNVTGTTVGWRLADMSFCKGLGIPEAGATAWKAGILASGADAMKLSTTSDYVISGDILWFPGQWDLERFGRECLELYAQLLIAWLGDASANGWTVNVHHRHFNISDSRDWPTPLKIFLRQSAWMPADEPSVTGLRKVVVRVSDIWIAAETAERFPHFLRRPAVPVMRMLERATQAQIIVLREHAGLRVLDDPATLLAQVAFLADQYSRDGFDRYYERHMLNLYAGTWRRIADGVSHQGVKPSPEQAPRFLLARRSAETQVFAMSGAGTTAELIYVRDGDTETAASLVEAAGRALFDLRGGDAPGLGRLMKALYGSRIRLLSEIAYEVTLDGRAAGEGLLVAVLSWCPRLKLMCAVAMEALKGVDAQRLPSDRQTVLAKLERTLIQTGERIGFRIDGVDLGDSIEAPAALVLKLADARPVVVCRGAAGLSWSLLDQVLGALCEAIDQSPLEANLRILLYAQRAVNTSVSDTAALETDLGFMCDALHLSTRARRAVRETLGAGLERHAPWLRALLYMADGQAAVDAFDAVAVEAVTDASRLREAISPWLGPLGLDADTALAACKTSLSITELRDQLGLDFEGLNLALVAVGQSPDVYPDFHARQLVNFVMADNIAISDALRVAFAPLLKKGLLAPGYVRARDAASAMPPDPAWQLKWKEVPEDALRRRVDDWLAGHGASSLGANTPQLEPLEQVRRMNGSTLKVLVDAAGPLVLAWCRHIGSSAPEVWRTEDGGVAEIRGLLDRAGVYDFQVLRSDVLLQWLDKVGIWPQGMRLTIDRGELGLPDEAVDAERTKALAESEARRKEARSVPFNGRPLDPEEMDWAALENELGGALSAELLKTPLRRPATLAPALPRTARASGGAGGWSNSSSSAHQPSAKKDLIGRLGELAVRRWLLQALPNQDIDAAWKSKNAEPFTSRPGSDSLGYDFEVTVGRQTWQIEVKASLNDPQAFHLGETEVRAGRAAARARSGVQYWIAYVSNISTPASAGVEMIPNPMSEEGEAVLNLLGEGLRYGFRRL